MCSFRPLALYLLVLLLMGAAPGGPIWVDNSATRLATSGGTMTGAITSSYTPTATVGQFNCSQTGSPCLITTNRTSSGPAFQLLNNGQGFTSATLLQVDVSAGNVMSLTGLGNLHIGGNFDGVTVDSQDLKNTSGTNGGLVAINDSDGLRFVSTSATAIIQSALATSGGTDTVFTVQPVNTFAAADRVFNILNGDGTVLGRILGDGTYITGAGGITIGASGATISKTVRLSQAVDVASVAAQTCLDTSLTVTGAVTGAECAVGLPASPTANLGFSCYVSAADTVQLRACNPTGGAIDPASATYSVRTFNP